ncbi:DHH family phosphoesterase [Oceanobacillus luteolus]|uniref:Cyclic-di-AMP phosphodiesterase n=1 Tax=Oceanobacillus luteolus TaxID=1274358 RepID=A0ABW4HNA1_9BACI|nr:DHH family phosphoesterase [Oceanobacillus luteolus]MCM3740145.1 DHH family phosphoesterase [Oceanobacillus luteolus]
MPELQRKRLLESHLWTIYILAAILLAILFYYEWRIGIAGSFIYLISLFYSIRYEIRRREKIQNEIKMISTRVKMVGKEALSELPFGIVLYDEDYKIEWANSYMRQFDTDETELIGSHLNILSEELVTDIKENKQDTGLELEDYYFRTLINRDERLIYFINETDYARLKTNYENDQTVLFMIFLDNYEDITLPMDDTSKSQLNSEVTAIINDWAKRNGLYVKRTSQERFLAIGTREILRQIEKVKFDILDEVREITGDQSTNVTLSIGVGHGNVPLPKLGELAQSSLDLALGRGGDQVAIRDESGKVRFYGGKTNPMEKRTRVRARVISHAMVDLVKASDNVIIMGHKAPDMDSVGSAIGILNIAKTNGVEGYIVFDPNDVDTGVYRLIEAIRADEELWERFIEPSVAEDIITNQSLVVIVDTHRPAMVVQPELLEMTDYKVVIDHHRRGEEFIDNPTLVYMEPYASSTAELVTELLEYQPKSTKLKMLEATALLSGIIVDTKSFTLRTGSRTFDAASYLRAKGADTVLVQQFLKEDLNLYLTRSRLIERTEIYRDSIAIVAAEPGVAYGSVLIAQTADTLLAMTGVTASFVISERDDGRVGVSARSLGKINVQVIMERMNGGGHLTNAATQIADTTVEEVELLLKNIIDEYFEGRETE